MLGGSQPTAFDYQDVETKLLQQGRHLLIRSLEFDSPTQLIRIGGRLRQSSQLDPKVIHPVVLYMQHPIPQLLVKE